jgi:hypothetical protein
MAQMKKAHDAVFRISAPAFLTPTSKPARGSHPPKQEPGRLAEMQPTRSVVGQRHFFGWLRHRAEASNG